MKMRRPALLFELLMMGEADALSVKDEFNVKMGGGLRGADVTNFGELERFGERRKILFLLKTR